MLSVRFIHYRNIINCIVSNIYCDIFPLKSQQMLFFSIHLATKPANIILYILWRIQYFYNF